MKLRISLSNWILILVLTALSGYALFGFEYYRTEQAYRELLERNSVYIQFEQSIRAVATAHEVATIATGLQELAWETVPLIAPFPIRSNNSPVRWM
jgi:hypothetical protein